MVAFENHEGEDPSVWSNPTENFDFWFSYLADCYPKSAHIFQWNNLPIVSIEKIEKTEISNGVRRLIGSEVTDVSFFFTVGLFVEEFEFSRNGNMKHEIHKLDSERIKTLISRE